MRSFRRPSDQRGRSGRQLASARGDGGVALIELAIVLPLLMCLVLGTITGGFALAKKNGLEDAIREGARFGATLKIDDVTVQAQKDAWAEKVMTRIVDFSGGSIATADLCVALIVSSGSAPAGAGNCFVKDPANTAGDYVVRVRGTASHKLEAFFFSTTLTFDAPVAARYERLGG